MYLNISTFKVSCYVSKEMNILFQDKLYLNVRHYPWPEDEVCGKFSIRFPQPGSIPVSFLLWIGKSIKTKYLLNKTDIFVLLNLKFQFLFKKIISDDGACKFPQLWQHMAQDKEWLYGLFSLLCKGFDKTLSYLHIQEVRIFEIT